MLYLLYCCFSTINFTHLCYHSFKHIKSNKKFFENISNFLGKTSENLPDKISASCATEVSFSPIQSYSSLSNALYTHNHVGLRFNEKNIYSPLLGLSNINLIIFGG